MFNSFSKFGAISQDKFYSPLFTDKSQAFAPHSKFIPGPEEKSSILTPGLNSKSFTPFSKPPTKFDNSISCLTSSYGNSNLSSSNHMSLQTSFVSSYFSSNQTQPRNVFDQLRPLHETYGKGKVGKISMIDINKEVNESFDHATFNLSSLSTMGNHNAQLLGSLKSKGKGKKRIRLIKRPNDADNYLSKKRCLLDYSLKDYTDLDYGQLEPVRPKPRKNIVLINNESYSSYDSVSVIPKKRTKFRDPNKPKGKPGRKPKYEYMKNMKICVCKLFFQLFSSSLNKVPQFSFNRRSVNRINKYIHYQDIIKEEPLNFSYLFNEFTADQQQNYRILHLIKYKAATSAGAFKSEVEPFSSLNFIDQIQNISIDLLNPTISSLSLSYLLMDIKKINSIIKSTPIFKINEFRQTSCLQIYEKPEAKVKKFVPFLVVNSGKEQQSLNPVITTTEVIKDEAEAANNEATAAFNLSSSNKSQSQNQTKAKNKIFIVKHYNEESDDSSDSEFDSFGDCEDYESLQNSELKNQEVECKICGKIFSSSCGLGGHMSKKHANSSEKYKAKVEVRKRREDQREFIAKGRRLFCEKFSLDFDKLYKTNEGRQMIKKLIKEKYYFYKECIKECKRSN